jgi:hypothetical protein
MRGAYDVSNTVDEGGEVRKGGGVRGGWVGSNDVNGVCVCVLVLRL